MMRLRPNEDPLMQDIDSGRRRLSDIDRLTRLVTENVAGAGLAAMLDFAVRRSWSVAASSTMTGGSNNKTPDSTERERNENEFFWR
jgi:hypothetical protein